MGQSRVAARDEQTISMHQVVVASGWGIGTQSELVASNGAAHAQA
jgi:hypothetical protein